MAAVVRLKRHLCEEPLEALVINCKRPKLETNDSAKSEEFKTVLKFAGTVKEQNEDLTAHLSKLNKTDLQQTYKKHVPDINSKARQHFLELSKSSRFKIVNLSRAVSDKDSTETDNEKILAVLDIETEDSKDKGETTSEKNFVYDLYYTNTDSFGDYLDDEKAEKYLRIIPAGADIEFEDYREVGALDDDESSSEDSNAESNWRNEYPDEDEDVESINDSDMIDAVENLNFKDNDLSSDDGEEGFVYSIDSEAAGFEEDLDESDVRRYGEMYARFKARQKKVEDNYNRDLYGDENDDDDDEYYDTD